VVPKGGGAFALKRGGASQGAVLASARRRLTLSAAQHLNEESGTIAGDAASCPIPPRLAVPCLASQAQLFAEVKQLQSGVVRRGLCGAAEHASVRRHRGNRPPGRGAHFKGSRKRFCGKERLRRGAVARAAPCSGIVASAIEQMCPRVARRGCLSMGMEVTCASTSALALIVALIVSATTILASGPGAYSKCCRHPRSIAKCS